MNIELEYDRVRAQVSRPSVETEVANAVLERLDWIRDDVNAIVESSYREWLHRYVRDRAEEVDNPRELCGCPAKRCYLKQGLLPRVESGYDVDEFIAEHRRPKVLIDGRREWESMEARVGFVVDRCNVALQKQDSSLLPDEEDVFDR